MGFISTFHKIIIKAIAENLTPTHVATVDENGLITKTPIELIGGGGTVDTSINTFIGGIGATTTTPEALAILLDISPNYITNFSITNNDIECNISVPYNIPSYTFNGNTEIASYWDYNGKVVSVGGAAFSSTSNIVNIYLPECISIGNACFSNGGLKKELIYLPKCISIGTSTTNQFAFWYSTFNNCVLYVDTYLETCNGGDVEGDIAYNLTWSPYAFKDVRYVTNFTAPNAINDLATVLKSDTAIELNWSAPPTTNTIDFYEIYVNGIYHSKVTTESIIIGGLVNLQEYNFTVKAVDVYYNKSEFSNEITENINGSQSDYLNFLVVTKIYDATQKTAINTLITDLKTNGLWSKMKAIYPFIGGTSATHKFNLKDPRDLDEAFRLTYLNSTTSIHSNTGIKGDGISNIIDTNFIADDEGLLVNNNHLSFYSRTSEASASNQYYEIGARNGSASDSYALSTRRSSDDARYDSGNYANNRVLFSNTDGKGFYLGTVNNNLTSKYYKNGVLKNSTIITDQPVLASNSVYILGVNGISTFSNKEVAFVTMGLGLTDAEVIALNTIVQAFQTTLGRNV